MLGTAPRAGGIYHTYFLSGTGTAVKLGRAGIYHAHFLSGTGTAVKLGRAGIIHAPKHLLLVAT